MWETCTSVGFLGNYREAVAGQGILPTEDKEFALFLDAFLLDKALYELAYELDNRPAWVRIPLLGILALCP